MAHLLGLLAALSGAPTDSTPTSVDSVAARACAPLVQAASRAPAVAADVWASVLAHNGVVRWDTAYGRLRLWVQPRPADAGDPRRANGEWKRAVLTAAEGWGGVVPGLAFHAVDDSAGADVVVTWDRMLGVSDGVPAGAPSEGDGGLAGLTAGRTTLVPGDDGRARSAHVRLAIVAATGARYGVVDARAVARHELGHVLGLAHHAGANSVMSPLVEGERLADGDRAALKLLYALPVGARCPAVP